MTDRISAPVDVPISRRQFLGAASVAALGGLSGCFAEGEPATTQTTLSVTNTATGDERTPIDGEEVDLGRNGYYFWEFTLETTSEVRYQVDVLRGDQIHVYIVTPEAYEILAENEAGFEAIPGSVSEGTYSGEATVSLDSGDYRLIISNSNADVLPENA